MKKEFHIRAKNYSNVFVDVDKDDDEKPEVYLALHIPSASCSVRLTIEQATELMEALKEAVNCEQVV